MLKLQLLISTMENSPSSLFARMNVRNEALVVNQCDKYGATKGEIAGIGYIWLDCGERGVGLSRNTALNRAQGDIVLFCDDDCCYVDNLEEVILGAFEKNPDADLLLFNLRQTGNGERAKLDIAENKRVTGLSYMRYGIARCAARRSALEKKTISFSTLFGGGSRYSCGEDVVFFHDCLKSGLRIYTCTDCIGTVDFSKSSWFKGYTEKYYYDRGALHAAVGGMLHPAISLRHALKTRDVQKEIRLSGAMSAMLRGAKEFLKSN
ncbi:glycosyltransferase family 2 protein [Adlercreutzia faecimuris]|uniref:Glycosyltransferase family 2 protein n=1 Tax=Adlercreutzia faecimuris TaxID=2897341 RepID=A0ABS9WIX0_9ACTN|nr:glycosyltransferase family A protein [Adlercreutzia sp. JBNU-10]MCI2242815.1 glycosyltransferase family 2 protein [Adlercreutzia sp. JBNU-10]